MFEFLYSCKQQVTKNGDSSPSVLPPPQKVIFRVPKGFPVCLKESKHIQRILDFERLQVQICQNLRNCSVSLGSSNEGKMLTCDRLQDKVS